MEKKEKERRKDHSAIGSQTDPRRVVIYARSHSTCLYEGLGSGGFEGDK